MNEQGSSNDAESILSAATALTPRIYACREEIERGRHLPLFLVDMLKQDGVFRMTMPRAWGGVELDPVSQLQIVATLSGGRRLGGMVCHDRLRSRVFQRLS
jgi:alkylation response protein AidB-like acyl-CoA dehydrogenase